MRNRLVLALAMLALGTGLLVLAPNASPTGAQSVVTPACDPAHEHASGDSNETIESGGLTREYILHVPPSYTGSDAVPLVLLFHGLGQGAQGVHDYTALFELADEEGFVLAVTAGNNQLVHSYSALELHAARAGDRARDAG